MPSSLSPLLDPSLTPSGRMARRLGARGSVEASSWWIWRPPPLSVASLTSENGAAWPPYPLSSRHEFDLQPATVVYPVTRGGGSVDPVSSSSGSSHEQRWRATPGSMGYRAQWAFIYFLKLFTEAGSITQPPRLIYSNRLS